ncbi:hypothetical protein [Alteromonas lipolytica]|uniref:Uncharacterized protein n=1 Tax=Alteromonas lipolytica TaxID=1856405 RepID=A0A1E8FCT6_9ALTE|nr:hypothetical protein [Alteromonas lipolytica]OFI33747.1 hypothetical protein BFC17_19415 [Alteromonas lipolytica]GGF68772.1 hypothetical protein GCM10011338_21220 [Alteromonas lipolytica]
MDEKEVVYEVQSDISPVTKVGALLVAWLVTYTIASVSQSQFVLANLESLGVVISGNQWLEHTVLDWWGLLPKYGSAVFVALALALFISGKVGRLFNLKSNWLHPLAGGLVMLLVMLLMQPILNVTLIAGTRSFEGQLWQVIAGLAGGFTYKFLRQDVARWIIQRPRQNALL